MKQNNQLTKAENKEVQEEKRVVFFEGNSWYHRTKELMDDLTTKYSKKGGFKTPEEAEKSYWEYEERYRDKQREFKVYSVTTIKKGYGFRVCLLYTSSIKICSR